MPKFYVEENYSDHDGDPNGYSISWDNTTIAEITKEKNRYHVIPAIPKFDSAVAWFDTEIEALEYCLELIKVHTGE